MVGVSRLVLGGLGNAWLQKMHRESHVNDEECVVVREMVYGYKRMCIRMCVNVEEHGRTGKWWREIKVHARDRMRKIMWIERLSCDN